MQTEVQNIQEYSNIMKLTNENLINQIINEQNLPPLPTFESDSQMECDRKERILYLRRKMEERKKIIREEKERKTREREEFERQVAAIDNNFQPGQFLYIKDEKSRELIKNGWNAVKLTEMENFVREDTESFQWSKDPRIRIINEKMESIENPPDHSGFTFGWTMRQLKQIFKLGEEQYRREILIAEMTSPAF